MARLESKCTHARASLSPIPRFTDSLHFTGADCLPGPGNASLRSVFAVEQARFGRWSLAGVTYVCFVAVPSIVVHKGSRSHCRPESPTVVVVRGGMPSLPSSRQGLAINGSDPSHRNSSESDMIDGDANPNAGPSPASNSLHRASPTCPPDKSDTENKNFRNRVRPRDG